LFGFQPDPAYSLAPFHPEAVNGLVGMVRWHDDGAVEVGFLPTWSEPPGRPILPGAAKAADVARYIDAIGRAVGLPALCMECRDGWYVVSAQQASAHSSRSDEHGPSRS
jgi:poly-gamma-glutamate synthesis protein (capsule biosynthesis protein)